MNKQVNMSFKIVALATLLMLVAGCASASTPTPSTPSIVGTWMATFTEADGPLMAGIYAEFTFAEDGRVSILSSAGAGIHMDSGSYTVTRDQLILTDELGYCASLGFPKSTYKWSVENDSLTLTKIDDACYIRYKSNARTWSRKTGKETPVPALKPMLK